MSDPRYPIGKFEWIAPENDEQMQKRREHYVQVLSKLPADLRAAVAGLDEKQLETPYRSGGWTVRQVVHHVADSHINAYVRFKLALTEFEPTIKTYREDLWARLPDTLATPAEVSLVLIGALHARWVALLAGVQAEDFARTIHHPEQGIVSLDRMLALYAWHSAHHTAHITQLRDRMKWNAGAAGSLSS
jgi:uncharacterized damage-inducible protein DinB